MKKFMFLLAVGLCMACTSALAWDGKGHTAIAYIAERHLTPRAKANIEKYIGNHSIAYYASWMDYYRKYPGYEMTHHWHVDYWTDADRTDADGNPAEPLAVHHIKRILNEMPDFRTLSDSTVNINIKLLVHMVGDMHCPVHIDFPKYRPIDVNVQGKKMRYHKMWDGAVVEIKHKGMSPLMLAEELDRCSDTEIAAIAKGTPDYWYAESIAAATKAYKIMPKNTKLTTDNYFNAAVEIADSQIRNAGYRLAAVLNSIFDK